MQTLFWILGILAALAGGGYAGYVLGGKKKKEEIEGKIGRTEDAMKKLVDEATAKAEAVKRERILEAKEEILRQKTETEKELRERRNETQRTERRLLQREEMLDKSSTTWRFVKRASTRPAASSNSAPRRSRPCARSSSPNWSASPR